MPSEELLYLLLTLFYTGGLLHRSPFGTTAAELRLSYLQPRINGAFNQAFIFISRLQLSVAFS